MQMPEGGGRGEGGGRASHGKEGASGGCGEVEDKDGPHFVVKLMPPIISTVQDTFASPF